jgi:hypothetical protein
MKYFFHVVGGRKIYPDENGQDFTGIDDARAHASVISGELAVDAVSYPGFAVCIEDEAGRELGSVPIGRQGRPQRQCVDGAGAGFVRAWENRT